MRIFRYFFVGGVAAAIDILIFSFAVKVFGLDWFAVAISSFLVATAVNYLLSISYVFDTGVRFERHAEVLLVFLVSGLGLILNQSVLWILIETFQFDEVLSKLVATGSVFFWNYTARSQFIFKKLNERANTRANTP